MRKALGALRYNKLADHIAAVGYRYTKVDLIDLVKELAIAIEEAEENFNEPMAKKIAMQGLKQLL